MGNQVPKAETPKVEKSETPKTPKSDTPGNEEKPKLKPCCVCLDTKRVRDECIIQNGEEHCLDLIEAHKKCMRDLGFNI